MPRFARRALTGAVLALAALSPAVASAQSPTLRVHAIFSGGQASNFHVGQVLDIDVRNAGGRKLTQVCMNPAPIARPACSAARNAAPSQAGPTTVQVTLSDGTKLTQTFTTHAAATKVGGPRAVPATITCQDVTLFGNYDQRRKRSPRPDRDDPPRHAGRPLQRHRAGEDLHVGLRDEQGRVRVAVVRESRLVAPGR